VTGFGPCFIFKVVEEEDEEGGRRRRMPRRE